MEVEKSNVNDLKSISGVCKTMLDLVDELDVLERKIYHIKTDLVAISEEHTDMAPFLRRDRGLPSMLHGVKSQKKPFHGLSKLHQFDLMRKIMAMRVDLTIKFEALRKAQMAVDRSIAIRKAFGMDGEDGGSYFDNNPEEAAYVRELLDEQTNLASKITAVEEDRMSKALKVLNGKAKITGLLTKFKKEFDEFQEDMDESDDENDASVANESCEEGKVVSRKELELERVEKRVVEMKTLIQKLMFGCPNSAIDLGGDEKFQDMLFFCGKTVEEMRTQITE